MHNSCICCKGRIEAWEGQYDMHEILAPLPHASWVPLLPHRECSEGSSEIPWWHLSPLSSALEDLPQHNLPDEVLQPGSAKAATALRPHLSAAVEPEVERSVQVPMQSSASEQTTPSEPPKKKGET